MTGLNELFEQYGIDLIMSEVNDSYNPAGCPALTVPAGYDAAGMPVGTVFVGGFLSEPQLLAVGHVFEQAFPLRVAPDLEETMALIAAMDESSP